MDRLVSLRNRKLSGATLHPLGMLQIEYHWYMVKDYDKESELRLIYCLAAPQTTQPCVDW